MGIETNTIGQNKALLPASEFNWSQMESGLMQQLGTHVGTDGRGSRCFDSLNDRRSLGPSPWTRRRALPSERSIVELCSGPFVTQPDHHYSNLARVSLCISLYRDKLPFAGTEEVWIEYHPDSVIPIA